MGLNVILQEVSRTTLKHIAEIGKFKFQKKFGLQCMTEILKETRIKSVSIKLSN